METIGPFVGIIWTRIEEGFNHRLEYLAHTAQIYKTSEWLCAIIYVLYFVLAQYGFFFCYSRSENNISFTYFLFLSIGFLLFQFLFRTLTLSFFRYFQQQQQQYTLADTNLNKNATV